MSSSKRVLVAMSGGVDSSVAAARLCDQGYDVVGVTLHLWDYSDDPAEAGRHERCCAPEDQYDARRTADYIGFPHYTFDRRALFERDVVAPFVEAYLAGETPSPCTACNRTVKLAELFELADRLGAEHVATGHYARVERSPDGVHHLVEGLDRSKDQSYFLYSTPSTQLERLIFPLGDSLKTDVRHEAIERGLPGATKGESQELCFVGSGAHAYAAFVETRASNKVRPGLIVDEEGRTVGNHAGIHRFTIGQRKGLGVAVGEPRFVTRVDATHHTVHLGPEEALRNREAILEDVVLASGVSLPLTARVRVRYRHEGAMASIETRQGKTYAAFSQPVRAVTRGQTAVFYEGNRVLGGGRIASSELQPNG